MIVCDKKTAGQFDVVVRTGSFPTQGTKVVLTKGATKISVPFADVPDLVSALTDLALNFTPDND